MKYNLYGVRDIKSNMFWQPQMDTNDETAKRGFAMMINGSDLRQITGFAPGDFDLYRLGSFDSETGEVVSIKPIEYIINGRAVLEVKDEK